MNDLIKISERNGRKVVSARELYEHLEFAPQHWSKWFVKNIEKNQFAIENEDWSQLPLSGSKTKDFAITTEFAKKICMMARTEKGEQARNYFIQCEKAINIPKAMSIEEMIIMQAQSVLDVKKDIGLLGDKVKELEAKSITSPNDYFTIAGYASLIGKKVDVPTAAQIGRKATNLCGTLGYLTGTIPDPRFGKVKTYPTEVLKTAFDQYYA